MLEDIIADYVRDLKPPRRFASKEQWREVVDMEYAAWSVYNYVQDHPEYSVLDAISHYISMAETISERHPHTGERWLIISDAANDIYDIVSAATDCMACY